MVQARKNFNIVLFRNMISAGTGIGVWWLMIGLRVNLARIGVILGIRLFLFFVLVNFNLYYYLFDFNSFIVFNLDNLVYLTFLYTKSYTKYNNKYKLGSKNPIQLKL